MIRRILPLMVAGLLLASCLQNSKDAVIGTNQSQVALRAIQSRAYDTTNQVKVLRTVIATLQDLGFVIAKADMDLGAVSGQKLSGYAVTMTVSARPVGKRTVVRANATYHPPGNFAPMSIEDPKPYQDFFSAFSKAMFLEAHEVE